MTSPRHLTAPYPVFPFCLCVQDLMALSDTYNQRPSKEEVINDPCPYQPKLTKITPYVFSLILRAGPHGPV